MIRALRNSAAALAAATLISLPGTAIAADCPPGVALVVVDFTNESSSPYVLQSHTGSTPVPAAIPVDGHYRYITSSTGSFEYRNARDTLQVTVDAPTGSVTCNTIGGGLCWLTQRTPHYWSAVLL